MSVLGGMNPLPKPDGPSPIAPLAPPPSVLTPTNAPFRMPKPDVTLRSFSDPIATRKNIYDSVLSAARSAPPVSNKQFTLQLSDVDYDGPDDYSIADQKAAILEGRTLGRKLRGTWSLIDNVTGQLVDKKTSTLARVPHLTQRGTFIHNGNEYAINSQLRLRPGIYTRLKENGEVEAHANIMPGKGASHRYYLDPAKGQFYAKISQAKIPVLPVLRALGAKDSDIKEAWGHELFSANVKDDDTQAINKLYEKLVKARDPLDDGPTRTRKVVEAFRGMELDPEVMSRTLKSPYGHIDADSLLATTKKLIAVSRGEDEVDDRDHLANQTVHGPEDFFAERISKDAGRIRGLLLWKAGLRRNLSHVQPGALTHQIESALLNSGLANAAEEINLSEILDKQTRITRLGEGGISDISAIPREARAVQPSHLGFIDPSRTSESLRIGIDVYMANAARKGSDGLVYSPFKDVRTGETIYKSPQEIAKSAITFPGELAKPAKRIIAMRNGKMQYMRREDIDYEMPSMEEGFSALSNLIPGKSGMKAQRVAMGSRMLTQALPLEGAEAPLVQNALPNDHSRSYEDELGMALGAVRANKPGRVIDVTDTNIKVKYDDGTETDHQIYKTFPFNRKSEITQTPAVTVGQVFKPGDLLAYSNHTDKNGTTALGKNFRTGYYAHKGFNFEDAIVISESAAKRLTSQHLYQHGIDWTDAHKPGKKAYIGLFPKKFNKVQYDTLDDDGVVKPGTVVNYGDPIIVAAKKRELSQNKIHKRHEAAFGDATETWQHHDPGIVADVAKTPRGFNVSVKSLSEMKVGDKMCFDSATSLLTKRGWKKVADIVASDELATLNSETDELEFQCPTHIWKYEYEGPMYYLNTKQINMLVTPNHRLWVAKNGESFKAVEAEDFYKARGDWQFKKECKWVGREQAVMRFGEPVREYKNVTNVLESVPMDDWLEFLGYYISEGSCCKGVVTISQFRTSKSWQKISDCLDRLKLKFKYDETGRRFQVSNVWLYELLSPLGDCYTKYVPGWVQELSPRQINIFFEAYMAGDGYKGAAWEFGTSSEKLAEGLQMLCMKLGWCVHLKETNRTDNWQKHPHWKCKINRFQHRAMLRKHKIKNAKQSVEEMVDYAGSVYCVTVPNHLVYVKREGKLHWSHNSGLLGDKSIVAAIVPDHLMPHDEEGLPIEVAQNPMGVISRGNPTQMAVGILGKIAAKTGVPYKLPDFNSERSLVQFAIDEAAKHGVKDLEDIIDPETGRKIPNVYVGNRFFMKLHHSAESKGQGRGLGGYTASGEPAKGGQTGSKKISGMDVHALLSHGAYAVLRDAGAIRGQRSEEYWVPFMRGLTPPKPKVPMIYEKFINDMRASGIHVIPENGYTHILPMTDREIDEMAGDRRIKSGETVHLDKGMAPVSGGLFDPTLTGSHDGTRWAAIDLHEPMPNPLMEDPIRRVLGLTEKQFLGVLSGREKLGDGGTGPAGIRKALEKINLPRELAMTRAALQSGRKTARDQAVRKLGYLKSAQWMGIHPKDWMLTKVPVMPPRFRPISMLGDSGMPLVSDPNYNYKELIDANDNLRELAKDVEDVGDERLSLYNAFKTVVGLSDPTHPKLREKNVKGILAHLFGNSPKTSMLQQRLISSTVDLVGRGVVVPDPALDMDQIGLPEEKAWEIYKNFIIRRLHRRGMPVTTAAKHVVDRTALARDTMLEEMDTRPVIVNRAPVLHRFGIMAFKPKLYKGDAVRTSPLIVGGFGMDYDGDTMQYHVPVDDVAAREALDRMLPSKNLISPADMVTPVHGPKNEYTGGLYTATTKSQKPRKHVFRNKRDAINAWLAGSVDAQDEVDILEDK